MAKSHSRKPSRSESKGTRAKPSPIRTTEGAPGFVFSSVVDLQAWDEMVAAVAPVLPALRRLKSRPMKPLTSPRREVSSDAIDSAIDGALRRLPALMKASGRSALTAAESDDLRRVVRAWLPTALRRPSLDPELVSASANFAGWKASLVDGAFSLTIAGMPAMLLADVRGEGKVVLGDKHPEGHEKSTVAQVAYVVDLVLELFGLVLGMIGVSIPFSKEEKPLEDIMKKLLSRAGFREALAELVKGMKAGDYASLLGFLEFLEGTGDFGELLAHAFAGLSKWDYALTLLKFLAWLAAQLSTGGLALAAELAGVALDIAGIVKKLVDVDEIF